MSTYAKGQAVTLTDFRGRTTGAEVVRDDGGESVRIRKGDGRACTIPRGRLRPAERPAYSLPEPRQEAPPLTCTLREGHRGDHWHYPTQDVAGACDLPAGPRIRLEGGASKPGKRHALDRLIADAKGHVVVASKMTPVPKPKRAKRSKGYMAWVRTFPCLCGCGRTPVEAHHFGPGHGMGVKASDLTCVPLAMECHRAFHTLGYLPRVDGDEVAARIYTEHAFYREQSRLLQLWIAEKGYAPEEEP